MTLNDVQRAQLALFAARAAGQGGSLEQMKAIAYCVRNRVKAGWFDGQWLTVMEQAEEAEANISRDKVYLNPNDRTLQRLVADIDDIYYGGRELQSSRDQSRLPPVAQRYAPDAGDLETAIGKCCYWCRLNRPFSTWFKKHVIDQPAEHPLRTQMGLMAFFE